MQRTLPARYAQRTCSLTSSVGLTEVLVVRGSGVRAAVPTASAAHNLDIAARLAWWARPEAQAQEVALCSLALGVSTACGPDPAARGCQPARGHNSGLSQTLSARH